MISKQSTLYLTLLLAVISSTAFCAPKDSSKPTQVAPKTKFWVFREDCFDMLLNQHTTTSDCISFTISKGLSLGIIAGSFLYKAPQIYKIVQNKSVAGISLSSYYFALMMVLVSLGYNIHIKAPIDTYAENISIVVQNFLLIVLHWMYNPATNLVAALGAGLFFAGSGYVLLLDFLPNAFYDGIGVVNIVLLFLSFIPQIYSNWRNQSTGVLASVTIFLSFAGSAARVFTTLKEVNDILLLAYFIAATAMNGILLAQIAIYGDGKKVTEAPKEKGTEGRRDGSVSKERKKPKRD